VAATSGGADLAEPAERDPPEPGAETVAESGVAGSLAHAVEQANVRLNAARDRAVLGHAEELRIRDDLAGTSFDIEARLETAQRTATTAKSNATRWQTRLEQAQATLAEVAGVQPEGSPELAKAQAEVASAERQTQAWIGQSEQAVQELEALQAISDVLARGTTFDSGEGPPEPTLILGKDVPASATVSRTGVAGELHVEIGSTLIDEETLRDLSARLPRVELIEPQAALADEVTPQSIHDDDNDFMRGIFRYAGLVPSEWDELFVQNDATAKRVDDANAELNQELTRAWKQGKDLEFRLYHHDGKIDLRIRDPAVEAKFVRASRRSSGFTHFFGLKTVLHAREAASNASSFIWLFDEPGLWLHPDGQHDLLQVLEKLAQSNQIVYSTHSIFLINKNHPTRHRLLRKSKAGTEIDKKPYVNQWRAAIEALGLSLPGTILFASKVLLVEGDSDPILLNADLQKLIAIGVIGADINPLSVIPTGNSKNADALIRILLESSLNPDIALLLDGDQGGMDRRKHLQRLIDSQKLPCHFLLPKGTTLEDHVLAPDLFREATIIYVESICDDAERASVRPKLDASYKALGPGEAKGLAQWSRVEGQAMLDDGDDPPSSVGIAREYARLLTDPRNSPKPRKRSIDLAKAIVELLDLPPQVAEENEILESLE
jgi:multidrug efflux pump subunit AcrA (membrane-fusion protein)